MNINEIVFKKITGKSTAEEETLLRRWLDESEEHLQLYNNLMNSNNFSRDYQMYMRLDTEEGWRDIQTSRNEENTLVTRHSILRPLLRYAAAIIILIVAGGGLWYSRYTKVTPPEISEAVQLAMQQSIQSGKQDADVSLLSEEIRVKSKESSAETDYENGSVSERSSLSEIQASLTKEQLLAAKRITTRHDKEFWVTLDDGTLVHLNYNTRLIYPEKFGRGDRNVILDGEAYFMVAKDKSRPFVVHTPQGDIKVYGTEFYVKTGTGNNPSKTIGEDFSVVLVQGSIGFKPSDCSEHSLQPGQQLSILNHQISVTEVDPSPYVAWNEGTFVFKNWSLERILNVLSLWYDTLLSKENFSDLI